MDVPLTAVAAGVENHRQRPARVPQVTPGKIEDAAGEDQEPQNIHHSHGPHHRPEDSYYQRIDIEDSGRLVIPKVAIEKLAVQKALPDDAIGGLISSNQVAKIGKSSQEHQT
jgi:hypothetical protein